ncbi:MAG: sulfatase-like hydrolase/transferase, partial [Planctomycetota bacterium]
MDRRQFLRSTAAAATALFAGCAANDNAGKSRTGRKAAGSRPNIVFILSDDMGWAEPGFNGGDPELTPNIDRLAAEGLKLTQFYTHSVCSPTRAAFLTGRYAFRNWMDWRSEDFGKPSYLEKLGLTLAHNADGEPTRRIHALDTGERTIAEALKEAGYFTAIIGKWHAGEWLKEHLPMQQGFMHQYGHYAWGIDYYDKTIPHNAPARFVVYDWHRNEQPIREEGYATDLIAAEAER